MSSLPSPSLPAGWSPAPPPPAASRQAAGATFQLDASAAEERQADAEPAAELLEVLTHAICPDALLASLQGLRPAVEVASEPPTAMETVAIAGTSSWERPLAAMGSLRGHRPLPQALPDSLPCVLDAAEVPSALAARIEWLAGNGRCEARIELHPQELGALQIRIEVKGEDTHVWFQAERPAARAALVNALPQLRQMLASGRLNLASAEVGELTHSMDEAGTGEGPAARRAARRYVVGILDELA